MEILTNEKKMTLKEIDKELGLSRRIVQECEKAGIVIKPKKEIKGKEEYGHTIYPKTDNRPLLYGKEEIERLWEIRFYRELGYNIPKIKEILNGTTFNRKEELKEQIKKLEKKKELISKMQDVAREILKKDDVYETELASLVKEKIKSLGNQTFDFTVNNSIKIFKEMSIYDPFVESLINEVENGMDESNKDAFYTLLKQNTETIINDQSLNEINISNNDNELFLNSLKKLISFAETKRVSDKEVQAEVDVLCDIIVRPIIKDSILQFFLPENYKPLLLILFDPSLNVMNTNQDWILLFNPDKMLYIQKAILYSWIRNKNKTETYFKQFMDDVSFLSNKLDIFFKKGINAEDLITQSYLIKLRIDFGVDYFNRICNYVKLLSQFAINSYDYLKKNKLIDEKEDLIKNETFKINAINTYFQLKISMPL